MFFKRGYQETLFSNLLELRSTIGNDTRELARYDYICTLWEGFLMANNLDKKGIPLALQEK